MIPWDQKDLICWKRFVISKGSSFPNSATLLDKKFLRTSPYNFPGWVRKQAKICGKVHVKLKGCSPVLSLDRSVVAKLRQSFLERHNPGLPLSERSSMVKGIIIVQAGISLVKVINLNYVCGSRKVWVHHSGLSLVKKVVQTSSYNDRFRDVKVKVKTLGKASVKF